MARRLRDTRSNVSNYVFIHLVPFPSGNAHLTFTANRIVSKPIDILEDENAALPLEDWLQMDENDEMRISPDHDTQQTSHIYESSPIEGIPVSSSSENPLLELMEAEGAVDAEHGLYDVSGLLSVKGSS